MAALGGPETLGGLVKAGAAWMSAQAMGSGSLAGWWKAIKDPIIQTETGPVGGVNSECDAQP
ncbi:hypothetical protein [Holophaga foetida]|uniref:hypothetical protein n=1 Tax=Holophaga foetida TaxID=35839 RepID=UPI0011DC926C|nr:hypothetical protein [Holophaga foetida]